MSAVVQETLAEPFNVRSAKASAGTGGGSDEEATSECLPGYQNGLSDVSFMQWHDITSNRMRSYQCEKTIHPQPREAPTACQCCRCQAVHRHCYHRQTHPRFRPKTPGWKDMKRRSVRRFSLVKSACRGCIMYT
jgi:hypothetical protein